MSRIPKHILVVATASLLCLAAAGCSDAPQKTADTAAASAKTMKASQPAGQAAFQTLAPKEAYDLIEHTKDLLIVDVRTPQEIQKEGMIAGSINLPFWAVLRGQHNLPKDRPLLVVCAVGGRSFAVGQSLVRRQGYRRVYNLAGGISAWKKAGLPVVSPR